MSRAGPFINGRQQRLSEECRQSTLIEEEQRLMPEIQHQRGEYRNNKTGCLSQTLWYPISVRGCEQRGTAAYRYGEAGGPWKKGRTTARASRPVAWPTAENRPIRWA